MEIFVTGGTGVIGSAVVKALLAEGNRVIGLARSAASAARLRDLGASAFPGDLCEPNGWTARAASCDAVIHAGAVSATNMGKVDRHAMLALKQAARHRKQPLKVVYTGGIWLFPAADADRPLTEKTPFSPLPAFRFMTETIKTLSNGTDLTLSVIHPALVCSPAAGPIFDLTQALQGDGVFRTRATPGTNWPLVHVSDLAQLYVKAVKQTRFRLSVIAATVPGISLDHLASHISARHGKSLKIICEPAPQQTSPEHDLAAGYALSQVVNSSHAHSLLGWAPEFPDVEDLVLSLSLSR